MPQTRRQLITLPDLKAEEFQHPEDAAATAALKALPGLDIVVSKVLELGLERSLYLENIASNVRVTRKMLPRLHRQLRWGCSILGVDEPELYVRTDPRPNAFTFGHTRPYVTMTTGLLDLLDEEETLFALGHELGHIKAGHVLYTTMARNIAAVTTILAQVTLGVGRVAGAGLDLALRRWSRRAELTADRAGLLCTQSFKPCGRAFMKLAGGARREGAGMTLEEFMRQVHAYEAADTSTFDRVRKVILTAGRSHPLTIVRAKELAAWRERGYVALLRRPPTGTRAAPSGR